MADIDNMRGDTLRVVEENTLDNMRGVTQRVISENSIDNTRGVTYRVYNVNGGSAPVIDELNVTPSTSAQTITAPSGTDGYSPVNVSAVTSAIDANIAAGNIKKDVTILGVTGSYEGVAPSGTKQITSNGIHDVAGYANADVNVPTTAPAHYIEITNASNVAKINLQQINFSGLTDPGVALQGLFKNSVLSNNFTFSLSPLQTISSGQAMENTFAGVTGGKSVNLTVDMSTITTISGQQALSNCFRAYSFGGSGRLYVDLSGLETVSGNWAFANAFQNSPIESISFDKLSVITQNLSAGGVFNSCRLLNSVSFGALKASTFVSKNTQLQYLFDSTTGSQATGGCTVHFPSNFDPSDPNHTFDASTLAGYPTFSGNASYIHVAFDLPATE